MQLNLTRGLNFLRHRGPLILGSLALFGGIGCASFWDSVTSRKFRSKLTSEPIKTLFVTPEPMGVLQSSDDAEERAAALRALREPSQQGAGPEEQQRVMHQLTKAATSDKHALCRIAAVQTLGRFRDPEAVDVLVAAYTQLEQTPSGNANDRLNEFTQVDETSLLPEVACAVQCEALNSLGQIGSPEALSFLLKVATTPARASAGENERRAVHDKRVSALRALQTHRGHQPSIAAIEQILRSERDIALRHVASEAYRQLTGSAPSEELTRMPALPVSPPTPSTPSPAQANRPHPTPWPVAGPRAGPWPTTNPARTANPEPAPTPYRIAQPPRPVQPNPSPAPTPAPVGR